MNASVGYRRILTLAVSVLLLGLFVFLGNNVQVPYVALGPGLTVNTLGDVRISDGKAPDGKPLERTVPVVEVKGVPTDPVDGHLNLTTVSVIDGLSLFDALGRWASRKYSLVPRETQYPPGRSTDEVREQNAAQMSGSELTAQAAALRQLNRPTRLIIQSVGSDGPANGVLRTDDEVRAVAGTPVATVEQMQTAVRAHKPGERIDLDIVRAGAPMRVTVTLGKVEGTDRAGTTKTITYLGVTPVVVNADPAMKITMNVGDIGGPSAGLMLSLALVDKLTPGSLTGGKFIAGTGTITDDGKVGPIGGITHKMEGAREKGATVFLVPADNCREALTDVPDGLTLVKVETLPGAIDALNNVVAGKAAPSCTR
ncbi:MAG TPA: PDZ domain-containing protein [Gordonia sp. (in: high G+C Gram-positive bacteria)]|uniref:YlbL family protein n=1 Tax=Gordonia sp. (in: high G+C Gram-positive bacteria) TaxID=84139 RepID=UPI0025BE9EFE|nr:MULTISPECIES: PDZ domain-containing protein [unclassified Gordonia (in: high G+C Gram-positive bacteria)]HNP56112.1 PDZ domain-containing protein [Gordonia sp. (in: high G+C Gram-positive bacteria)]HRC49786.1 PDZ domain-containing protein [Gordonia sp. (in: high G+C Gram-positive bacteria)]